MDNITQKLNPIAEELEVIQAGNLEIVGVVGSSVSGLVNHNLGFIPVVIAFFDPPEDDIIAEINYFEFITTTNHRRITVLVNESRLLFQVELGSSANANKAGTYIIRYYILRGSARI